MSDITAADTHTAQGGSDAIDSAIDPWAKLKGRRARRRSRLVEVFIVSLRTQALEHEGRRGKVKKQPGR
jgi:hypothetical protein